MHRIALCLMVVASAARADGVDFEPAPTAAIGLAVAGHVSQIGGGSESGGGADLELALGRGRTQYFADATLADATLSSALPGAMPDIHGMLGRGGVGLRWLARQMQPERGGGFELFLEAVAGVERYSWRDGGTLTRPDLGVGIGWQVRVWQVHGFTLRFDARVLFTPTDRDATWIACRGSGCPIGTSASLAGLALAAGLAW